MIILGLDPGLATTGWGIVEFDGHVTRPVSFGVLRTKAHTELSERIFELGKDLRTLVEKFSVDVCSIEDIYFARNITSAVPVAKVIGAFSYVLKDIGIPSYFYSPLQIKMAVTGTGTADKRQIQELVKLHLHLKEIPKPDHAADALADCLCYINYDYNKRLNLD